MLKKITKEMGNVPIFLMENKTELLKSPPVTSLWLSVLLV